MMFICQCDQSRPRWRIVGDELWLIKGHYWNECTDYGTFYSLICIVGAPVFVCFVLGNIYRHANKHL